MTSRETHRTPDNSIGWKPTTAVDIKFPTGIVQVAPDTRLRWQQENPKKAQSKAHARYELYKTAKTFLEFAQMQGDQTKRAMLEDLKHDAGKGFVEVLAGTADETPEEASRETAAARTKHEQIKHQEDLVAAVAQDPPAMQSEGGAAPNFQDSSEQG